MRKVRVLLPFIDVLFVLIAVLVLYVNITKSDADMSPKVEYAMEVVWPEDIDVDIDTWIMRPDGVKCSYQNKDTGHVSLTRDDLGGKNDPSPVNIEISEFRKPMDGYYYVSMHNYRMGEAIQDAAWTITIVLRQVGAVHRIIYAGTIAMPDAKQEAPVFVFIVEDGEVVHARESARRIVG